MKTPCLSLLALLVASASVSAQTEAQSPRPNYFGTATEGNTGTSTNVQQDNKANPAPTIGDGAAKPGRPKKETANNPDMKRAFDLLSKAKDGLQPGSRTSKAGVTAFVEAARESLKKTPGDGRWHGHRNKALQSIDSAVSYLKSGDRGNNALAFVSESIAEVEATGGL